MHASYLFRHRTLSEMTEKYPGAAWIFWCDLSPFGAWSTLMNSFDDYVSNVDPDAAYVFIGSKFIVGTTADDADFRSWFEDPPFTAEDV